MTDATDITPITEDQPKLAPPVLEREKVYESTGPQGEPVVIMLAETWADFGTNVASMRQIISNLSRKLEEAKVSEKVLLARLTDTMTRLDNLRAVRRAEKRPEVEAALGVTSTQATEG